MGSYLSAPMLVFRSGVLPRACETPCGDGPAGPLESGPSLFLAPLLARQPPRETDGIFYFVVGPAFSAIVSQTRLVTFHIQSLPLAAHPRRHERGSGEERMTRECGGTCGNSANVDIANIKEHESFPLAAPKRDPYIIWE